MGKDTTELLLLQKENAQLMLDVNSLREYALENTELKDLLKASRDLCSVYFTSDENAYLINAHKKNLASHLDFANHHPILDLKIQQIL